MIILYEKRERKKEKDKEGRTKRGKKKERKCIFGEERRAEDDNYINAWRISQVGFLGVPYHFVSFLLFFSFLFLFFDLDLKMKGLSIMFQYFFA